MISLLALVDLPRGLANLTVAFPDEIYDQIDRYLEVLLYNMGRRSNGDIEWKPLRAKTRIKFAGSRHRR
jgi:hypothetical protein